MTIKKIIAVLTLALALILPAFAHDLFLKLDSFFVAVNQKVTVKVLNGSFMESEGAVTFARLKDLSVVAPSGARTNPKETDFTVDGKTSLLNLQPTEEGNYVVGLATMRRDIALGAKDFNGYLEEDGIPDMLAERKRKKELNKDVKELYSKNVKTIFQVGDKQTDSYKTALGYEVELVPQQNPYLLKAGQTLEVLCLKDGKPLVNQFVMSGYDKNGKLIISKNVRSDKKGIAKIKLTETGRWYVKFIQMQKSTEKGFDYESKWTTLTFEIK